LLQQSPQAQPSPLQCSQPHAAHWPSAQLQSSQAQLSPQQHAAVFAAGEAVAGVVIPKAPAIKPTRAVIKNLDMVILRESEAH
jgi:hypothetical protein